jgi:hypothetical protein
MDVFIQQLILMLNTILKRPPAAHCMEFVFYSTCETTRRPRCMFETKNSWKHIHVWAGRDLFRSLPAIGMGFFQITGETPETLLAILRTVHIHLYQRIGRPHKLSPRNLILLFVLWLRSYPSYHMLSSLFDVPSYHMLSSLYVSVSTVQHGINIGFPIFEEYFGSFVRWPTLNEWLELRGEWQKLPLAVGAIDSTSCEIYCPQTEP